MSVKFPTELSLAPGFSPVCQTHRVGKLFQQLLHFSLFAKFLCQTLRLISQTARTAMPASGAPAD